MNVLIIGNNPKHAKVFSVFADNVYLLLQNKYTGVNRVSRETLDYILLYSDIEYNSMQYFLYRNVEIRKLIKQYKIDVVFSNTRDDMIQAKIATWRMNTKPVLLVTFHNSTAWVNDYKVRLMSVFIKHFCDGCICLASFMHKKLIECGVKKDRLLYLPNTIQFENFTVKQSYQLNEGKVHICYTAVISPLKNQELIIDAIYTLKDKHRFEVHLFGDYLDESYYIKLKKKIDTLGLESIVYLDGPVENDYLKETLCKYDIYLSSTMIEMSPYNILEAKAAALPILASRVLGQSDLIEDGFDGVLFDCDNLDDLVQKLDNMISNSEFRKQIGTNARVSVSTSKSYAVAAKKLLGFIDSVK